MRTPDPTFALYRYATAQDRPLPVSPPLTLDTIAAHSAHVVRLTLVADPARDHHNERIYEHVTVSCEPVEGTPGRVRIAPALIPTSPDTPAHEPLDWCTPGEILHIEQAVSPHPLRRTYTSRELYRLHDQIATLIQAGPGQPIQDGRLFTGVLLTMRSPDTGLIEIDRPGHVYKAPSGATVRELHPLGRVPVEQLAYVLHLPE
ncbi:hypothetical protein ACWFMI_23715 [Nocardiopsis terrae]|uniref:hypothetical protein n=1 Tax=Streptomyces sp. NPDC057554 TaxID=3350538 RepID=UPI0036B47957